MQGGNAARHAVRQCACVRLVTHLPCGRARSGWSAAVLPHVRERRWKLEKADETHYLKIVEKLGGGRMIPFLGAGANLVDRGDEEWDEGADFLPNGSELARHLAERGRYPPLPEGPLPKELDLLRVVEYVAAARRRGRALPLPARGVRPGVRADVAAPSARTRGQALERGGAAAPAGRDDELRRPGRARVRRRRASSSTSSGTRRSRTPRRAAGSCTARPTARPS